MAVGLAVGIGAGVSAFGMWVQSMMNRPSVIQTKTATPEALRELEALFGRMEPENEAADRAAKRHAQRALANRTRYERVAARAGAPWEFLAAVNTMEAGGDFDRHIAEGSPLTDVPKLYTTSPNPPGNPPWTWESASLHYLQTQGVPRWKDWSLGGLLWRLEAWNGLGYRNRGLPSHYLFGRTTVARPGRFVADGKFDPAAKSAQTGAALVLREIWRAQGRVA